MNIHQYDFINGLGIREKDLEVLPQEIQMEFDRLADMGEPRDPIMRRRCYDLAGPFRRAFPRKRRF
ncbi:hypothetical protein [Mesorhizobium sp. M0060]|uniref:hypothetical protein n=1 Tax=Mesorhizobium sp. M0060 TaxID=2956866 RepID=UPI0033378356